MTVRFACGHVGTVKSETQRPTCPECGSRRIRTAKVRPPVFRGTVTAGPCAHPEPLGALVVNLRSEGTI